MSTIDLIRKINPTVINDKGIDSFERQLINLSYGLSDMNYPMIISTDSQCLSYIAEIDTNKPLIINPRKVLKIKTNHNLDLPFIMNCYDLLRDSLFAIGSLTKETSKVILLDKYEEETGNPIIAICRYDAKNGEIDVNQITSYYGKETFCKLLINSWNQNKRFDKNSGIQQDTYNKKIERLIKYTRLQLPNHLIYALSNSYSKQSFTKSQVMEDLVCDPIIIDENEEYRLFQCSEYVFEVRDMDDTFITYTYSDNLEEALDELQNQNELCI